MTIKDDKLAWFTCYPTKWLSAFSRMKPMEALVYFIVCLRIYEVNGPCRDSLDGLSRLTGLNRRRLSDTLDSLFQMGKLVREGDGIMNPFAVEVLAEGKAIHEERIRAGRTGGLRSAEKRKQNQYSIPSGATAKVEQRSTHLHNTDTVSESAKADSSAIKPKPKGDWPDDYREQFWKTYPRHIGKAAAMKKLEALAKSGTLPWKKFIDGVTGYVNYTRGTEEQFIKHPTTWLNQGCWDDEFKNGGGTHETDWGGSRRGGGGGFARVAYEARRRMAEEAAAGEDELFPPARHAPGG